MLDFLFGVGPSEHARRQSVIAMIEECRKSADATHRWEQSIRALHPEVISAHQWAEIRSNFLTYLSTARELHLDMARAIEAMEASRERSYPQGHY